MFINQILTKLKSLVYSKSETDSLLNGKASSSHTHTKSQITDFPTIPSKVSQLTNDSGFITGVSWDNVSGKPSTFTPSSHTHTKSQITDFPTIPTNTNQLTNGAGFITSSGSCNYANSAGSSNIATRDSGGSWISGRDNAVVKQTRHSTGDGYSWNPAVSVKTKNGNWTIGTVGYERLQFSYDTDEDYNTGNNRSNVVELNPEAGTIITSANIGSQSVNYANSAGSANWLRTSSHADHLFHTEWDGSYFWTYVTAGDGGYRAVRVERSNSSGYADSVAWSNVSGRPTALSQFTNDSGFITTNGAAYPRRVGGVTMNFNWSGQGGQPTWLWGGEDGTNMYVYNPANFSVNYANSAGSANWLRTSSHADHLFHTEWDGSYFWTYVTAGDGGYRAVRVERSNSSGYADSVAWSNVSGRPTALSQFTNDSGFITSAVKESSIGGNENYCLLYGNLLIQFGTNVFSAQSGNVTFKKTFSSAPIVIVNYGDDAGFGSPCCLDEAYKTYFTATQRDNSGLWRCNWLAIGKS